MGTKMNKQLQVWKLIAAGLQQQIPITLLYVLESSGSSPGRQGFFMTVNANDEMAGSIGGGIMEHRFVEMAKKKLLEEGTQKSSHIRKQVHDKASGKNKSGMICSGEQTILIYMVKPKDIVCIQHIIALLKKNNNATLIFSPAGIQFDTKIPPNDFEFTIHSEDNWLYKEKIGYKNSLTIIGGGHCSLAFSRLMSQLDFYIRIYDIRKCLNTMLENDAVHEKHFLTHYSELNQLISSGPNHYVVIMTFGYRTDDIALRALLNKEFRYLGLLGSKAKIEKMFSDYRKEELNEKMLQRIHSPIGIPIKSQTPDEIAISIAAEIISEKNKNLT
ncbi:XdhC/CoxI family protein [soil metagenome]